MRFVFFRLTSLPVALVVWLGASPALAGAAPHPLGKFGYWDTYSITESGQQICYMSLSSRAPAIKGVKRGNVVLMVTHRPAENTTDVVSYSAGLKFKPASEANISVGGKKYGLFTQGDTAWSRDQTTDHVLASAIRSNPKLMISGLSAHGSAIGDIVSLKGAPEAYHAISKTCGVPVAEIKMAKTVKPKTPLKPRLVHDQAHNKKGHEKLKKG